MISCKSIFFINKSNANLFFKIFNSKALPEAQSFNDATVEDQLHLVVNEYVEEYKWSIFTFLRNITDPLRKRSINMESAENIEKFKKILETEKEVVHKEFIDASEKDFKKNLKFDKNLEKKIQKSIKRRETYHMTYEEQNTVLKNLEKSIENTILDLKKMEELMEERKRERDCSLSCTFFKFINWISKEK